MRSNHRIVWLAFPFLIIALLLFSLALIVHNPTYAQTSHSDQPKPQSTTINVNTFTDELINDGNCSLREAVQAANTHSPVDACPAGTGDDTIVLPDGTYILSIAGSGEDNNQTGDLDVSDVVTITGTTAAVTYVQAGTSSSDGIDRVFHVLAGGHLTLEYLTVRYGYTTSGSAPDNQGGGVYVDSGGKLDVYRATITNNTSSDGGGIYSDGGDVSISESVIADNEGGSGGGGFDGSGTLIINLTSISNNTAGEGAGLKMESGEGSISNSTFSNNIASEGGAGSAGGLDNAGTLDIWNSTFAANSAVDEAGGIRNSGTLNLRNSTVADNGAPSVGGLDHTGGLTLITNSIIANNIGGDCSGAVTSADFNIDGDNTCNLTLPRDHPGTDPLLAPLGDYGGYTWTEELLAGSPAIDAGDCSGGSVTIDQRGASRPKGSACDIGAFEFGPLAADDAYFGTEDTLLSVPAPGVMTNDYNQTPISVTAVQLPANGDLVLSPDGAFTYNPNANFNGIDNFSYIASDGVLTDSAVVTVTVNAVNDPPVAAADSYTTTAGAALSISAPGVLGNDTDIDSNTLKAVLQTGPQNGTLALEPDGSFLYTPKPGFVGTDQFEYSASDGLLDSTPVPVTIAVEPGQYKAYMPFVDKQP